MFGFDQLTLTGENLITCAPTNTQISTSSLSTTIPISTSNLKNQTNSIISKSKHIIDLNQIK